MGNLLIPLGIIVLMAVLGQLMNWLKRTAEKRQMERGRPENRDRERDRPPVAAPARDARDISRFLRAVDAQRNKPAATGRAAKAPPPVPTVAPARKPRLADITGTTFPEAKPRKPTTRADDDLPVATVVTAPTAASVVTAPAQLAKPVRATAAPVNPKAEPTTPFGKQFAALLKGPNAAALAVVLNEVLGPPKCKR